jgi:hypothetical protein
LRLSYFRPRRGRTPAAYVISSAYAEGKGDAEKRALPAFCFQAHFKDGKRHNASAVSSGLYMLDIDHIEGDAWQMGNDIASKVKSMYKEILLIHITPSGHGLRIVARATRQSPDTIAECQAQLAAKLGLNIDTAVKDIARASFAVPRDHIIYYNPMLFTAPIEKKLTSGGEAGPKSTAAAVENEEFNEVIDALKLTYEGVPVSAMVAKYFEINGKPEVGGRNTALYKFARSFRYLCDFKPSLLAQIMPHFGLGDTEVKQICHSACDSTRGQNIPQELQDIAAELQGADEAEADSEQPATADASELPTLPPVIADFVKASPDDFKIPTILAALPPIGAQLTALRADYLDNSEQSPSFMTVIEAPQASGKSFTRRIVNCVMKSIKAADDLERLKEQAYREELKLTKNKAKQPSDPRAVIRYIPVSVSIAKLLQRMDYAGERHLFSFSEEMDTMTKSNKAGAWAQKSDIYRNAFDNAEYGQDYISEGTYSAVVKMFYNILVCGTPQAVSRFFKDAEDGLVSRFIFCKLPSQFGKDMPVFKKMPEKQLAALSAQIETIAKNLGNCKRLALSKVKKAVAQWLQEQKLLAVADMDTARDTFRRRAAVIGFRAAMVAFALWDCDKSKESASAKFGLFVADQVLAGQLDRFSDQINGAAVVEKDERKAKPFKVLNLLPDEFSRDELASALKKCHRKTSARVTANAWINNKLIEKIDDNKYKKLS